LDGAAGPDRALRPLLKPRAAADALVESAGSTDVQMTSNDHPFEAAIAQATVSLPARA
jgi:hypothetical protein